MAGSKVLVLGGGFGGVQAAIEARASLDSSHEVTIVDKNRVPHLCGMNPLLIVGERDTDKTGRSLGRLANRGINFVEANIDLIDTANQQVATSEGTLDYDYLVVALGAAYDWDAVPGARNAYSFYDFEYARHLRRRISRLKRGKIVIAAAKPPYKCPPAPLETAMMINWWARKKGIRKDIDISVYIPEPGPLGVAGKEASMRVRKALDQRGIELVTAAGVTEVSANGREASFADGSSTSADIIATIPVHKIPDIVAESGIANGKPWVPVNNKTLETSASNVFAIGDVNVVPSGDFAIPKAGVFAAGQGTKVGEIIASRIKGSDEPEPYDGVGFCYMAYSGGRSATVGGEFLTDGGPQTVLTEPTVSGMKAKDRFERDWRNFKI
ncbi:MAG TPA: NAD(P)/FAD-dependent oxidoreductase [Dehalococcoidia bacterium]|nr:NAD(P)/FAD-dependent oxidoreductase [Dehalococcoidia bacterium]